MKKIIFTIMALTFLSLEIMAQDIKKSKMENNSVQATGDVLVDIKTSVGDIRIRLYGETPKHRDNFLKLVEEGFEYNSGTNAEWLNVEQLREALKNM